MDKTEKEKEQEQLTKIEQEADKEFNRTLEKISKDETTKTLEEIYYIPKQFAKMVGKGFARGLLLYGETGLGKTYSIMKAFNEIGVPFVLVNGHITSLELYHFLFEHRTENIVLDDVNVLENDDNLNMLKACLSDNSRVVHYHTTSSKLRVPKQFVFEGRILILLNEIPKKMENLKAVESRFLTYELKLSYETKLEIIFELAKQDFKGIPLEERLLIANWIKDNTSEATENLNLRLLFSFFEIYRYDKENWIKFAERTIKTDEDLKLIVVDGLSEYSWCNRTGKHRATFYRLKKQLNPSWKPNTYSYSSDM